MYYTIGRLVVVSFTLNVTTIAKNTVVATGLPLGLTTPISESAFTVGAASNSRTVPMYVNLTNGNLTLGEAAPSAGWYGGSVSYFTAS